MGKPQRQYALVVAGLEIRSLMSVVTVVSAADSGPGSLRNAVEAAKPGDTIRFASRIQGRTIRLVSPLVLATSLTIDGPGSNRLSLSGGGSSELFVVDRGVTANLSGLTMTGGSAGQGGAIDDAGTLTVRACTLSDNEAIGDSATAGAGGAIYNEAGASLTLAQSRLVGNVAVDGVSSGGTAMGGAVFDAPASRVSIRGTSFARNQARSDEGPNGRAIGGAIGNTQATLVIRASRFVGNDSQGFSLGQSGAINNREGTATISGCLFVGNQAVGTGVGGFAASGAITNVGAQPFSTAMTISRSRLICNLAVATSGGDGINSLSAAFGGAMGTSGAGVVVNMKQSILAGNQAVAATPRPGTAGNLLAGIAVGGAIENDTLATFNVSRSTIRRNRALGGISSGGSAGGAAFGGGIGDFMSLATLHLVNVVIAGNSAQGGGGTGGDGFGGGVAVFQDGHATLARNTIAHNRATSAPVGGGGSGGLGLGGGLLVGIVQGTGTPGFVFPDDSSIGVRGGSIVGNSAVGGSGIAGGGAAGGGIDLASGSITIQSTGLFGNVARGGRGLAGSSGGDGLGGGAFAGDLTSMVFQRASVINNKAIGGVSLTRTATGRGMGGGLYITPTASVNGSRSTRVIKNRASTSNNQVFGTFGHARAHAAADRARDLTLAPQKIRAVDA